MTFDFESNLHLMSDKSTSARYPVLLVGDRRALMVGGGNVAERKVRGLLDSFVAVTIIAPTLTEGLQSLRDQGALVHLQESYPASIRLEDFDLIFAATNDRAVNAAVAEHARGLRIPVNVADDPSLCDFYTTGQVRTSDGLIISISSADGNPVAVKSFRKWLEARLAERRGAGG